MSANPRVADYAIHPQFTDRWSPRAFTGETIPEETLLSFFEAARWAPSAYNSQPWRFLYARRFSVCSMNSTAAGRNTRRHW
jgi:Nitroreductase family